MKRFLFRLTIGFIVPVMVVFLIAEVALRNIPNDYEYKKKWLDEHSDSIQVLILGSSHAFYGIDPSIFKLRTFNAAHVSQSIRYDQFILNEYMNNMKSLKYLILPVSYFSLFSNLEGGIEDWRAKYYSIYYGCNFHLFNPAYNLETYDFNKSTWKRTLKSILGKENHITVDSLGMGLIAENHQADIDWRKVGLEAVKRHTSDMNPEIIESNSILIYNMIENCKKRGIKVILITTPTDKSYYKNVNEKQYNRMITVCNNLEAKNKNVTYINLFSDKRFNNDDFYDSDHLCKKGAIKLSKILNDTLHHLKYN